MLIEIAIVTGAVMGIFGMAVAVISLFGSKEDDREYLNEMMQEDEEEDIDLDDQIASVIRRMK